MTTGSGPRFRRSSYCGTGNCVEVAHLPTGTVAVRDSKRPSTPYLVVTRATWDLFQQAIRAGEFDR